MKAHKIQIKERNLQTLNYCWGYGSIEKEDDANNTSYLVLKIPFPDREANIRLRALLDE